MLYTCAIERKIIMADINVTFIIDEKYRDRIKNDAEKNYRSISAQIRLILENYLDNNK